MAKILWTDDEIDLLKPHILFLKQKGYDVETVNNGRDAIDKVKETIFDVIFLDENMPGLSGLETLNEIKQVRPNVPVVMITKSEEEYIMEEAIGSKIADYLIKPVNPNQILLSLKKTIDHKRLVTEKTNQGYQQDFRNIGMAFMDDLDFNQWKDIYRKLVYWELELGQNRDSGMYEVLETQKKEANANWADFVENNYIKFLDYESEEAPPMSHTLLRRKVIPEAKQGEPFFFILIDNLRYDQWKVLEPIISEHFNVEEDDLYMSTLPTTTHYCRNSIFSGLLASDIEKRFPNKWTNDEDEGGHNLYEEDFVKDYFQRLRNDSKITYTKITNLQGGKDLVDNVPNLFHNDFNIIVYNFIDTLSHARTDVKVMRELAEDEAAYRSLTVSWFLHSPLWEAMKRIAEKKVRIVISTDHGSKRVDNAIKIIGDRNTNTNLRYKQGKNLNYNPKEVFEVHDPAKAKLPTLHVSSKFVFAKEGDFFAYPNNYNHYVKYYNDTFQHGGISLEEMVVPVVTLTSK